MAQQYIDFGTFPDDPSADAIRTAFQKANTNFSELYATTTAGSVTSVNRGAGITVNSPTGNVIVTANIACVQVSTSSLSIGQGGNGGTTATITSSAQTLVIDINPANVFSANFSGVSGALANVTGTLTSNSNSQPNITSVGTLTSLAVTGNITSGNVYANSGTIGATLLTGALTTSAQPNITSVGTLGNLNVTSNSNLGNLATANFFSGDGHLLSNLTISAGSSIINGNSNVTVSANGNVTTSVAGNSNILTVTGTGTNVAGYLTVTGNVTGTNANLGNAVTANYFIGSGNNLSNIQGSNVTGAVANATYAVTSGNATTAGTVTTNAQPNITSVGTLTSLGVNGTVTAVAFTANTGIFTGNANGLSSLQGVNVVGTLNSTTLGNSTVYIGTTAIALNRGTASQSLTGITSIDGSAATVTTNAQPNITSVGTLSSLSVTANITAGNANLGNLAKANFFQGDGSLLSNINITAGSSIVNGNSNVSVSANGNVATSVAGNANILLVTGTGVNVAGTLNATGTISGNFSGNVTNATQANITSLGTLTSLTVSGTTNLGAVGNVTITGGTANYYLMTNGSGGLSWTNALLTPIPGSNTQVLFNDAGAANASSSLTFNKTTGTLTATLLGGTLTTAAQPNITSIGTLGNLIVTSNLNAGFFKGEGGNISNVQGANVSGTVGLATYATTANAVAGANVSGTVSSATTAGTVTTAAQPNITSVGTLTSLTLTATTGTLTVPIITTGANTTAGTITGNWSLSAGSQLRATYADLAEYYAGSEQIEPGTVVEFGGEHEVQICNSYMSTLVAGIVTTAPAYLMNSKIDCEYPVAIALQGRIPAKVIGPVKRGDLMVSANNGYAIACTAPNMGTVLGKAITEFAGEIGVVEIMVGRT